MFSRNALLVLTLAVIGGASASELRGLAKETVTTVPFSFGAIDVDFDSDKCVSADLDLDIDIDTDDGHAALLVSAIFNEIAKKTKAGMFAVIVGHGELEVRQHGNAGAVTDITLGANMFDLSVTMIHDGTKQIALAGSYGKAIGSSGLELCDFLGSWCCKDFFDCAGSQSVLDVDTGVYATIKSSSKSKTFAGSEGMVSTGINVEGKNLQKFTASIVMGGGSFVAQKNKDFLKVWQNAFMEVYTADLLATYTKICNRCGCCLDIVDGFVFEEADLHVDAAARAFAKAQSRAVTSSVVQAGILAQFERTPGDPENNNNEISIVDDASADSNAFVWVGCHA